MRTVTDAQVTIDADFPTYTQVRYVESSLAEDLEAQAQAIIDIFPSIVDEQDWLLSFVGLAGGGDGNQFALRMHFVNLEVDATAKGVRTTTARVFAYQAASAEELTVARDAVQPRLAALFIDVPGLEEVTILQTLTAGSSKGTETVGLLVVGLTLAAEEA